MLHIYFLMLVGYLISTIQGFDGSLMGAINAMEPYHESFGLTGAGTSTGLVFIIYNIAQIAAFPFCGGINDKYGRRVCMFTGCFIVLVGTAVQGSANSLGAFIGGRFVLGFGAVIAHAAAPAYVVEMAPPKYRGVTAGLYNNFWWVGNILAGWTTYGTNRHYATSWAWRIPTILQAGLPAISMILVFFIPESPRWLISKDRTDEALQVLAKYHGDGDANAPIVQLEYREIMDEKLQNPKVSSWWDYRDLVATRSSRYRLMLVCLTAFFGQWSGNNVVSYFMPAMIENAGITDKNTQLLINAINPILCWLAAMIGSSILDKFGRRKMMMGGLAGALACYIGLTACTAQTPNDKNLSYGVIVFIYLFGIAFAMGMTPSATLYPMEVLENRTRAKGSALKFVFLNIATMTNTFGVSVGIKKLGWKLYVIYICWIAIEIVLIFLLFVETKGKTLEELGVIFQAKNPRKASTQRVIDDDDQEKAKSVAHHDANHTE
ncbi:lactose permease [Aaosphaeria arxii CBS 175.79]|uniref:Lactose permease n=1 Tax=Aaosphaeria arxii CBS 175.79 TaxID=1450172 RepID=A0A6A5XMF3_9PLEO|nr:lactose permease [Aaosphaeria arxii CBS 175.79]KAF2014322.1 lactose permease [Aaosphaeria arxii CBS 175.79]